MTNEILNMIKQRRLLKSICCPSLIKSGLFHFDLNKLKRVSTAVSLLARQQNEPFLDRVITGDEKWIMYHNINRMEEAELHAKKFYVSGRIAEE